MSAATKLKEIYNYLVKLNPKQTDAVLVMVKTLAEEQGNDPWKDDAFIAELDRRTAEYEKGKAKVLTLDELELRARKAYKSKTKAKK